MSDRPSPLARTQCHSARGQALVEFAIVAPLFFLVLFGIVEAGRFMLFYETLNNATREGARFAIVNGPNSLGCPTGPRFDGIVACDPTGEQVKARVRAAAFGVLGDGVTVTPEWPDRTGNSRGSTVIVRARYTYSPIIPVPLPEIQIEAESRLVVNN